jgi:hypothetical protein
VLVLKLRSNNINPTDTNWLRVLRLRVLNLFVLIPEVAPIILAEQMTERNFPLVESQALLY